MKAFFLFLLIILSSLHPCDAKGSEKKLSNINISFDRKNRTDKVPKYRKAQAPFRKYQGKLPSRKGLDNLMVSASGQPTEMEITFIKDQIDPDLNIVFVDVRKEKHGYLNGEPILWMGMSKEQIISLLPKTEWVTVSDRTGSVYQIKPLTANTEEGLTQKHGISVVRFPTKHAKIPPANVVDDFVDFVDGLDSKTWMHIHCREGYSRTTMFFIMLDMLHNADKVSREDIIQRQRLIGGANMAGDPGLRDQYNLLLKFYRYARLRSRGLTVTWSYYIETVPQEMHDV